MDDIYLWKWAGSLDYENIIFIIKCLVGARLIFILLGAWELLCDERESHSLAGQIRALYSGKILKIRWELVHQLILKWMFLFILVIFHKEILRFVLR